MSLCLPKPYLIFCTIFLLSATSLTPEALAQAGSWTKLRGPYEGSISRFAVDRDGNVYAATQFAGMYRSTDNGAEWTPVNNGLSWQNLTSLAVDTSGNVYAGNFFSGLYKSTDRGESWQKTPLTGGANVTIVLSDGRICVGGMDSVYVSTDGGQEWSSARVGDTTVLVMSLAEDRLGNIYAGLQAVFPYNSSPYGGGIYMSSDGGKTWQHDGLDATPTPVPGIAVSNSNQIFLSNGGTILSAVPNDTNWVQDAIGLPHSGVNWLSNSSTGDVVAAIGGGLYVHNDATRSWDYVLGGGLSSTTISGFHYDPDGTSYAATSRDGVFKISPGGSEWLQCGIYSTPITALTCDRGGRLLVGTNDGIYCADSLEGMWIRISDGLNQSQVYGIDTVSTDSGIYAATSGGVYYSRDGGISWTIRTARWAYDISEGPSGILSAGTTGGVLLSTQGGTNWTPPENIGFPVSTVYSVLWTNGYMFAGASNNGVFVSTDNGTFWSQTGLSSLFMFYTVRSLAQGPRFPAEGTSGTSSGSAIYAGTDSGGAYYTVDLGQHWTHIQSITASDVSCFLFSPVFYTATTAETPGPMFVGSLDGGVFASTDGGRDWESMNRGLTDSSVASLAMDREGFLYAATDSGLYKTADVITSVASKQQTQPIGFELDQNYPNPFNPTTAIRYRLSAFSRVTLKVYDVIGREVGTLVNRNEAAGSYSVTFDGSKLASGFYFCRIVIVPQSENPDAGGRLIASRKMVLLK